ncbi:TonB-dependent receptor [Sphingomonas sp. M6A6_1c]
MNTSWLHGSSSIIGLMLVVGSPASAFAQDASGNVLPSGDAAVRGPDQTSAQSTTAADAAATEADAAQNADIVVTGLRQSLASAQNLKRNNVAIVDALVAEDIGKFPDNNAAEALARVTGVQVERFRDEANGVVIRGLPNVQTTLQGREIFTADGRTVSFQDFPAQSLAKLEVFKNTTADNLEGGIAGLINIGLRRPFDFKGFQIAGAVRGTYNDQSRKYDPNGSLLVSDRWQTGIGEIGALINVSYTRANYLNSVRYQGFQDYLLPSQTVTPASVGRSFTYPQDIGLYYARGYRERPSVNGSLQWRPADNLEVYADGLWQAYRGRSGDDFFGIPVQTRAPSLDNVVLIPGGQTPSRYQANVGLTNGPSKWVTQGRTDTYQGAVGAKWTTGIAELATDLAYTKSIVTTQYNMLDTVLTSPLGLDVRLNVGGSVDFTPSGVDFTKPSAYNFRGLYDQRSRQEGSQWQSLTTLKLDTGIDFLPKLDFGFRYASRDASSLSGDRYGSFPQLAIPITAVPGADTGGILQAGFRGSDVQQFRSYWQLSTDGIVNNLPAIRQFVQQGLAASGAPAALRAQWASAIPAYNPVNSFAATERTIASYAQGHLSFDVGIPIEGVIGARLVVTNNTLRGTTSSTTADGTTSLSPVNTKQSYVDVLPNVNLQARLTDKLVVRAAFTKSLTRPGFNQINPALVIQQGTIGGDISYTGNGGNQNLQPIRSTNYDASVEYYFGRSSSVSVAGFYRKINGFIDVFGTRETNATFGPILVYRPQNAGKGQIKGVEAAVSTFFDFLPGLLSGFGVQANGTYIDGTETLPSVPGLSTTAGEIPNVSKWSYNLIGLYEKGPVSVRLAYNKRTRYISSYTAPGVFATVYNKAISRLDLSTSLDVFSNVTITADATNLLGKPWESYVGAPIYPRDVRYEGRIYSVGARFRF